MSKKVGPQVDVQQQLKEGAIKRQKWPCDQCDQYFYLSSNLSYHKWYCHQKSTYACPVPDCTFSCARPVEVSMHYSCEHANLSTFGVFSAPEWNYPQKPSSLDNSIEPTAVHNDSRGSGARSLKRYRCDFVSVMRAALVLVGFQSCVSSHWIDPSCIPSNKTLADFLFGEECSYSSNSLTNFRRHISGPHLKRLVEKKEEMLLLGMSKQVNSENLVNSIAKLSSIIDSVDLDHLEKFMAVTK